MSIIRAIEKSFKTMKTRNWDKVYYYFDIHETILYPDYDNTTPLKFYKHAEEVLQYLSKRNDIVIALYTCSYPIEIDKYLDFFDSRGIKFEHVNANPDVANTSYGFYEDKPYFNVLFEDKAGFDPENDWIEVKKYFGIKESIWVRIKKYFGIKNKIINFARK